MRWMIILLMAAANGVVVLHALPHFLTTLADLPIKDALLLDCAPDAFAKALGHASHAGAVSMQNDLLNGAYWLVAAMSVNLAVAVGLILRCAPRRTRVALG
jgi:hypothetical protein